MFPIALKFPLYFCIPVLISPSVLTLLYTLLPKYVYIFTSYSGIPIVEGRSDYYLPDLLSLYLEW